MRRSKEPPQILLTGATGYVGGRLRTVLEQRDVRLRCLARRPAQLRARVADETEVVGGDVLAPETLGPALEGVDTAFYLIHSMGSTGDFIRQDAEAAESFAAACRIAGVRRIVYLGGLGASDEELSPHLHSRQQVGAILGASGVPTVELRASIVIGSGSLSFEMVRTLVERLPIMLTPRWVRQKAQPIAIEDLLAYLVAAIDVPADDHRIFEIGGADEVSYGDLMREYARQRGLRRWMIPVPLLTPGLSRHWLGLVTPLYARVGRKLVDSIRHPTVVTDRSATTAFDVEPMGAADAIRRALVHEDRELAETRWNDAVSATTDEGLWRSQRRGSRLVDDRALCVPVDPPNAFRPIRRIGGRRGWYFGDALWQLRSLLDVIAGGPGLRRGRRHPEHLRPGDTVDFWRVEAYEPDRLLRLQAEMRLPGRAWLQFEVAQGKAEGTSTIRQVATFDAYGVLGRLYWYGIYPIHALVFRGMLRAIGRRAQLPAGAPPPPVRSLAALVVALVVCLGAAAVGGALTATSVNDWYPELAKPPWNPPAWVFGPVWTTLFVLMAVALWRVWAHRRHRRVGHAIGLFGLQLALNVTWSALFFGLRSPGAALVEIPFLWLAIAATTVAFWRIDRVAGALLLPYLGWSGFAIALNAAIWSLNR